MKASGAAIQEGRAAMGYVFAPIIWILSFIANVLLWVVTQLLWIVLWLVLPLFIFALIALRLAEYVLGREKVRSWVKARAAKYGTATSIRARRALFALGTVPLRVLFFFTIFAVWHSIVSLAWRPKWSPWRRAWAKRSRLKPKSST
jgi:hypothetical protein